jgi:micrococcal nuclease
MGNRLGCWSLTVIALAPSFLALLQYVPLIRSHLTEKGLRVIQHLAVGLLLFMLHPSGAFAGFVGPVVSVLDGDTIEVLHNTTPEHVRLSGVDCPESGQAFGNRAKQATSALVLGRDVILQTHGQDKHRRTLADVFLSDGTHVNHELVKAGWCWWYKKYAPKDTALEGLEKDARDGKKGLWAEPNPVPPWLYRRLRAGVHP